ncbi:hypothetical protein ACFRI7_02180 [Streptomyces sp. NPDC056716]|uniref:hypothetical protein n=1 Tax=unclassified Streptomyces TaxID=2593676 RepID=UPI0036C07871
MFNGHPPDLILNTVAMTSWWSPGRPSRCPGGTCGGPGHEGRSFPPAGEGWSVPHDPITVLSLLRPQLYETRRGSVEVTGDGVTHFHPDPDGPVDLVTDADFEAVAEARGTCRAGGGGWLKPRRCPPMPADGH